MAASSCPSVFFSTDYNRHAHANFNIHLASHSNYIQTVIIIFSKKNLPFNHPNFMHLLCINTTSSLFPISHLILPHWCWEIEKAGSDFLLHLRIRTLYSLKILLGKCTRTLLSLYLVYHHIFSSIHAHHENNNSFLHFLPTFVTNMHGSIMPSQMYGY